MKYKVPLLKELGISDKQILQDDGAEIIVTGGHSEDVFIKEIRKHQVDMIMCRAEAVAPAMMDAPLNSRIITEHGAGLNNIDVEYAAKEGIQVAYAPLGNYNSVAEHMIVLILTTTRRYRHVDRGFRSGNFDVRCTLQGTFELKGLTLGILGHGRIGQIIVNKAALGFGMSITNYGPYARQENMKASAKLLENRDDVLARADFVNLNLSSLPPARDSIDYAVFQKVKPKAFFINCNRSDVVVRADLIKILQGGLTLGAGLDVFDRGPIGCTSPMLEMDNVITIPHTAAITRQTVVYCCIAAARSIIEVMSGKPITFPDNKID